MANPPLENGKKTKGRQRREMRRIENKASRQVTFSKRKKGLWNKADEFSVVCGASVGIVVFSEAGKVFVFASPYVDGVLGCGGGDDSDAADREPLALEALRRETEEKRAEVKAEAKWMCDLGKKVVELQRQTGKRFWWDVDQAALGEEELPVFVRSLQRIRDNVRRHIEKLPSTPPHPQAAVYSAAAVEPTLLLRNLTK